MQPRPAHGGMGLALSLCLVSNPTGTQRAREPKFMAHSLSTWDTEQAQEGGECVCVCVGVTKRVKFAS